MDGPGQHRQVGPNYECASDAAGTGSAAGAGTRQPHGRAGGLPDLRAGCVQICGGSESADAGKAGVGSDRYGGGRCAGCGRKAAAYAAGAAGGCFTADSIRAALPQSAVSGGAGGAVQRADGLPGASGGSGRRGGAAGGPERREGVGPVADLCGLSGKAPQRRRGPQRFDGQAAGWSGGVRLCRRKICISRWLYILYCTGVTADFHTSAGIEISDCDPAGRRQRTGDF